MVPDKVDNSHEYKYLLYVCLSILDDWGLALFLQQGRKAIAMEDLRMIYQLHLQGRQYAQEKMANKIWNSCFILFICLEFLCVFILF